MMLNCSLLIKKSTPWLFSKERAGTTLVTGDILSVLTNLTDEFGEGLLDIDAKLGRGGQEGASESPAEIGGLLEADLVLFDEITLVSDQDDWHLITILRLQDSVPELTDLIEGGPCGEGEDQQEALTSLHVLVSHGTVLLLSGCVQDVQEARDVINSDLLPVRVLNGWIVLLNEVILHERDGDGGLAHTSRSNHDDLELITTVVTFLLRGLYRGGGLFACIVRLAFQILRVHTGHGLGCRHGWHCHDRGQ